MLVETTRNDDLTEAQHSVATLLRHCFEWLQHCSALQRCVALKIIVTNCSVQHHLKQQRRRTKATKTSLKKSIRATSDFFPLIPTRSICQMLANFSGVEFLKTVSKFRKRNGESLSCVNVLDTTWNCSRVAMARKYTKERCTCKVVVYIYNPFHGSPSLSIRFSFCEFAVLFITSFKCFEGLVLCFTLVWVQFSLFKFW